MAVGSILSQIAKLVARQKTTKGLIKNAVKNKLPHTKLKAKEKMLDKSIKRLETKAAAAKTTSKDGQRLATEISNKERKTPDSAKALQFSDPKDAQMARMGSYAGRNKEMVRLREAIKKAKEKTNLSDKAKEELKRNEVKYKDMVRRLGKPADEKKAGGPIIKKAVGGKVYSNIVSRKTGGAIGVGAALRGFGKGYKKG
jgi:hypothetical protein